MRPPFQPLRRCLAYLWASPNTLLALVVALPILLLGGRLTLEQGVLEVSCPQGRGWFRRGFIRWFGRYEAVTLGHVVIADCADTLCKHRDHERVHVRQYERWGVFFLPAYATASVVAWLQGRHFYWDNVFEVQARDKAGQPSPPSNPPAVQARWPVDD